jgi:hypothetical protein
MLYGDGGEMQCLEGLVDFRVGSGASVKLLVRGEYCNRYGGWNFFGRKRQEAKDSGQPSSTSFATGCRAAQLEAHLRADLPQNKSGLREKAGIIQRHHPPLNQPPPMSWQWMLAELFLEMMPQKGQAGRQEEERKRKSQKGWGSLS